MKDRALCSPVINVKQPREHLSTANGSVPCRAGLCRAQLITAREDAKRRALIG